MWSSTNEGQNKGCLDEAIGPIMEMVNDELFSNLMEEKKVAAIVKKTAEASKTVSYNMLELLASRMSKASIGPMLTQLLGKLLKSLCGFYCVVGIFCVCSKVEKILKVVWIQSYHLHLVVDNTQQCFAFMSQANFPAHNLNFH